MSYVPIDRKRPDRPGAGREFHRGLAELDTNEGSRGAVQRLDEEERGVSDLRGKGIETHDALQDDVKRRLRAELGNPAS